MEIWTRERDSNSHNRICSTTHNLSVITRVRHTIFYLSSVVLFLYIDKTQDPWANADAELKQDESGDPGDRVHQQ